jgi:hypothetical protein
VEVEVQGKRTKFKADFKARVALEALKESIRRHDGQRRQVLEGVEEREHPAQVHPGNQAPNIDMLK